MDDSNVDTMVGVLDKKMNRQLKQYLDICARCAICKDACHQYVATDDFKYLPARRAELIRQIYKKYFTKAGQFVPALYEARAPTRTSSTNSPSRRTRAPAAGAACTTAPSRSTPRGSSRSPRRILIAAGRGDEMLEPARRRRHHQGRQPGDVPRHDRAGLQRHRGRAARGAPATRHDRGPRGRRRAPRCSTWRSPAQHTILPAARIFHAAKQRLDALALRGGQLRLLLRRRREGQKPSPNAFIDEAVDLGVKEVVITECGHAYRVAKLFYEAWAGEEMPFKVTHILEVIDRYMAEGRLKLRPDAITETDHLPRPVSGRAATAASSTSRGASCTAIVERLPRAHPQPREQWCCGGGGGLVASPRWSDAHQVRHHEGRADPRRPARR